MKLASVNTRAAYAGNLVIALHILIIVLQCSQENGWQRLHAWASLLLYSYYAFVGTTAGQIITVRCSTSANKQGREGHQMSLSILFCFMQILVESACPLCQFALVL